MAKYTLPMDLPPLKEEKVIIPPPQSSGRIMPAKKYPFLFLEDSKLSTIDQIEGTFLFKHVDDAGIPFTVQHSGIATHQYVKGSLAWLRVFCCCGWCKTSPECCNSFDIMATLFAPNENQTIEEQLPLNKKPSGRYSIIAERIARAAVVAVIGERRDSTEIKRVIDETTLEAMMKGKRK